MTDNAKPNAGASTALYLHPDDGHTLDCTRLQDGWLCSSACPEHLLAVAQAVHRLKFPNHPDCKPGPVEVRDARLHLEAIELLAQSGAGS